MCNGEGHGRTSQGGTLAVLRPVLSSTRPPLRRELSLRLAETSSNTTIATLSGLEDDMNSSEGGYVLIHRDGDLRSEQMDPESVLHALEVPKVARDGEGFVLGRRLDLGVGGEGVIGRRVSFVLGRRLVGQGIMGWN